MPSLSTRLLTAILVLASAAACSGRREAPACSGPAFALNRGLWTPPPAAPEASEP